MTYLVDTSSWIEHFKSSDSFLSEFLLNGQVVTHDFVLGELSLGGFSSAVRAKVFSLLSNLERIPTSSHQDVISFVAREKLVGSGVGWIDCHLLHACHSVKGTILLTKDKNLAKIHERLSS